MYVWPVPDALRGPNVCDAVSMMEKEDLVSIANMEMPFGKYKGRLLMDLPEEYLLWFVDRGFPRGKLGDLMKITLEIKINGLEALLRPLRKS